MPKIVIPDTIMGIAQDVVASKGKLGIPNDYYSQALVSASMIADGHPEDALVLRLIEALLYGQIRSKHMAEALKHMIGRPDYVPFKLPRRSR